MKPQSSVLGSLVFFFSITVLGWPAFGQSGPFELLEIRVIQLDETEVVHPPNTTITVDVSREGTSNNNGPNPNFTMNSRIVATVDKLEFEHLDEVNLTGDFSLISSDPPEATVGCRYRVGGQNGSIGGTTINLQSTPKINQTASSPGAHSTWHSSYFEWVSPTGLAAPNTNTLQLHHVVLEELATQVGAAQYYTLTVGEHLGGLVGDVEIQFIYFRGPITACDPPIFPEHPIPEGEPCESGGIAAPPGAQSVLAPAHLLSHGIRVDYNLNHGLGGGDCQGCGSESGAASSVPLLYLGRYLYPNNQHVIGNSSPGHVFNFDHRIRFFHDDQTGIYQFTLFDANSGITHWGSDSGSAPGSYTFANADYFSSFNVVNGSGATITNLVDSIATEDLFVTLVRRGGWEYKFKLVNVTCEDCDFNPMGRIVSIKTPEGQSTNFTYKSFSQAQINESPRRLLQIDTITDAGGNVAKVKYHGSQFAGRWVISEFNINDGDDILTYTYNSGGQLITVAMNGQVKSEYSYGADPATGASTIVWYERLWKAHSRDVLFLSTNYAEWDEELVNQFSDVLLARGEGATNPNAPPSPYFRVHRSQTTPGLYRINDRLRFYEWKRGHYLRYFTSVPAIDHNTSGFEAYNNAPQETTYAEHRNAEGGQPSLAQILSGRHPIIVDATGYAVTYTYDSKGYVSQKTYYDNTYEKFLYNAKGQLTYYRNRGGYVTIREIDASGKVTKIATGLNDQSGSGNPTSTPTAIQRTFGYYTAGPHNGFLEWTGVAPYSSGNSTPPSTDERMDFIYGPKGQFAEIYTPKVAGQTTRPKNTFTWTNSRLFLQENPLGVARAFTYDAFRRTTQVQYADGTYQAHYDDTNRTILTRDRVGSITQYVWNIQGHPTTVKGSYGQSTSWPTISQINDVNLQHITHFTYFSGPQSSIPSGINENAARTAFQYDYRGRRTVTDELPRQGTYRRNHDFYVNNLIFKSELSFGGSTNFFRRTFYGRSADRQTIRQITTRDQNIQFASNAAIMSATRLTGTDVMHSIVDSILDSRGNVVQTIDPVNSKVNSSYDSVGHQTNVSREHNVGGGTTLLLVENNLFNGKGQLVEQTDAAGTKTAFTYDPAGNIQTRKAAAGTSIEATWSYTYKLDGRQATETQPNLATSTNFYDACCGRYIGTQNALGHGTISNADAAGRVVHSAMVADFATHSNPLDPDNSKTLSEVTTRYRQDGRIAAKTKWKNYRDAISLENPPIAGLDGVSAADGITVQYLYDNQIGDGYGLDSAAGMGFKRLGSTSTTNVNIQSAISKLTNNGVTFEATRCGRAIVAISPDEFTMQVTILDAMDRPVFNGVLWGPAAAIPPGGVQYDAIDWNVTLFERASSVPSSGYCEAVFQVDRNGKTIKSAVDGHGNVVGIYDQLDKLTRLKYDSAGSLIQNVDPLNQITSFEYDGFGRQTKAIDPMSNTTQTIYHAVTGRVSSQKDPKNQTVSYTYDALGRVLTTTDRTGNVITQTYNNIGRVATVTDASTGGRTTAYGYNALGQRILTTYSDNGQQTIDSFDAAGRPLTITKPSGRKQHLTYDELGNVDQVEFKNAAGTVTETLAMSYDAFGRETQTTSSQYGASTAKTYNSRGLLANESTTYSGQTYTVQYGYDGFGRLNKMTYPSGKVADYTFDDRHQLKTISWQSSQIESRTYNDVGQLTGVTRPFVNETRAYNTAGRLTSISSPVSTMTYGYDANGNVTSETLNNVMANYSFTTVSGGNSGYDGEDRFMRYIRSGVNENITLTRSNIGNITNVNRNGSNTVRGYNDTHGLTTVSGVAFPQTYDLDGNTTKLNTNVTASWDDAGRTMNTNTPNDATAGVPGFNEYGYVGGTRVWKKITRNGNVETRVYVHAGPNLIAEYIAGVGASTPVQEYVYADQIDSLVMIHRSNNQKLGVTRNRQWSVVGLHDLANGNVVERYAYDMSGKRTIYAANGTTVRTTSSYGNNFGYTSRWHDEESGLMYFRARYYNPLTGEFLSRDPLKFTDGLSMYRGYFSIGGVDPYGLYVLTPNWHHVLPWEFMEYYLAAGIDLDNQIYGVMLPGRHPEGLTEKINRRWKYFFKTIHAGKYPTREEILKFHAEDPELQTARQMEKRAGGQPATERYRSERNRVLPADTRARFNLGNNATIEDLLVHPEFLAKAPKLADMPHIAYIAKMKQEIIDEDLNEGKPPGRRLRMNGDWAEQLDKIIKLSALTGLAVFAINAATGEVIAQEEADKIQNTLKDLMGDYGGSRADKAAKFLEAIKNYNIKLTAKGMSGLPENYMIGLGKELAILNFPYVPGPMPASPLPPGATPNSASMTIDECP